MQLIHYYFLEFIQDKYIPLYIAKGYLPNTLLTPRKLQGILAEVKKSLQHTNLDYTLVLDRFTFVL